MDLRGVVEFLKDASVYIIILAIMVLVFMFVVAFQPVAGNSMYPTVEEGNVVVVTKILNDYNRNDIIVFKDKTGKSFIKRIIGLPGEEIHYLNNILYVDGKPFKETYLSSDIKTNNFLFEDICSKQDCKDGIIPKDMYLVLGDNRPQSQDSRDPEIGLISKKDIGGIVRFRIWPLNEFGKVS